MSHNLVPQVPGVWAQLQPRLPASKATSQAQQLPAPYWYANAQSRLNLQCFLRANIQISLSRVGGGCWEIFFPPAPGQTGKINLALVTEDTHPLPEAFFGLNRKAGGWQVQIPISPFAENRDGEKSQVPFTNCCSQLLISSLLCALKEAPSRHLYLALGGGSPSLEIASFLCV